ncbi:glucose-methanol-choline oxidoreductase [Caballeronia catudaia]|uniref:Glucose-methanol-choline oxidoreductase n=1 Tax=Caballeronia catudaia TaxID=1777136 RepID=A0A158CSP1_9BURK|nr:GMC family oxidoreductase N-terminal domain-containing protein [Caballeronia catudaia]SAK85395.1 glucose-methanol-choline oxidoreductase [Caballeronia catudaia]
MEMYDYVIVGAGSAGCVLARRLSERKSNRVLMLEAGPTSDEFWVNTPAGMAKLFFHKTLNWNYLTEPMPTLRDRRMYWPRGRGLGGSSSINGMVYIRGHRNDFDHWESLGNQGWGFDRVLPYFKRMEHNARGEDRFRGVGGPLWISDPVVKHPSSHDFIAAAMASGIPYTEDLNGAEHDAVGFIQHNIRAGRRHSAYSAYVAPVVSRSNLSIRTGCHVQRVKFDGRDAVGVEVIEGGERRVIYASREVIVSAGALNSPHLLMLSGIGPLGELQRHQIPVVMELPGVGRNLQDHFYVHCSFEATRGSSYNQDLRGLRKYWQGIRYLTTHTGYLALGSSQVAAFIKSRPDEPYGDLQISFRPMSFTYHHNGYVEVEPTPAVAASVYQVRPASTGTVTLKSANPNDAPAFTPNYLTATADVQAMIAGIRKIREIMSREPMASRIIREKIPGANVQTDEQLLAFMEQDGSCAFHPAGTCKMGSDLHAVVDERLRVRGVSRLRVIDASIMPRVTAGNTNAPTMMIGEKGADMILEDAVPPRASMKRSIESNFEERSRTVITS